MSFILLLLFILFIYVIVFPLFRIGSAIYKARKQMQSLYDTMNGKTSSANSSRTNQQYTQNEKKIDPNVGEYVDFEDIPDNTSDTQTQSSHKNYAPSSPIEDAEWEDLN